MKIYYMSDLHLEVSGLDEFRLPRPDNPGDVLVLAGDIFYARALDPSRTDKLSRRQRAEIFSFFAEVKAKFRHCLFVPGNHEFWGCEISEARRLLRRYLPRHVTLLDDAVVTIDGVTFVGGTLWTDLDRGNPLAAEAARASMRDFAKIKWRDEHGQRGLWPGDLVAMHGTTRRLIAKAAGAAAGPVVVITHHGASRHCLRLGGGRPYEPSDLDPAYVSEMDAFIAAHRRIRAWICGHTHRRGRVKIGAAEILMNCRGYRGIEPMAESFEVASFEIAAEEELA